MVTLAPWQVWWADFSPQVGREQAGRRPAVIVGTDLACSLPNQLAVVVPFTTKDRGLPFHPPVDLDGTRSFAMTDQIKTISVERLHTLHQGARLTESEIAAIRFSLRRVVDISGG